MAEAPGEAPVSAAPGEAPVSEAPVSEAPPPATSSGLVPGDLRRLPGGAPSPLLGPLPRKSLARFAVGFGCPFRAVPFLLFRPPLWIYLLAPLLVNLLLLGLALWGAWELAPTVVNLLWTRPADGVLEVFWVITAVLTGLLLIMVALALSYAVAGIVATPFNDLLSEKVVEELLGPTIEPLSWRRMARDTVVSVGHSLLNLLIYLLVMVPLFLLDFVPVVGPVLSALGSVIATSFFLGRDLMDGPLTRRRLTWRQKASLIRRQRALSSGLGAAAALLLWIPVVNLLLMPLAITGGALLYSRLLANGLVEPPRSPDQLFDDLSRAPCRPPAPHRLAPPAAASFPGDRGTAG